MDITQDLEQKISAFENNLNQIIGAYKHMQNEYNKNKEKLNTILEIQELSLKAIEVLNRVQQVTREKTKREFESLVSFCLNFIFEEPYTFKLDFEKRGNLQNLNFKIEKPGYDESYDLLSTQGGGVLNIISFALRIILMEISSPKIQGFFLADEPFANLSENYHNRASLLLEELSKKLKRQFIIISHENLLKENQNFNLIEIK